MAMKFLEIRDHINHRWLLFKWQWRVEWQINYVGATLSREFSNRNDARRFKSIVPLKAKPRLQRRLVQANWEDYNDSFRQNAGRCG